MGAAVAAIIVGTVFTVKRNGSNKKNGPRGYPQGAIESGLVTLFGIFYPNN